MHKSCTRKGWAARRCLPWELVSEGCGWRIGAKPQLLSRVRFTCKVQWDLQRCCQRRGWTSKRNHSWDLDWLSWRKAQSLTYHRLKFRLRVWVRVMVSTEIMPRAPAGAGLQQGCQGKGWAKDRNHCWHLVQHYNAGCLGLKALLRPRRLQPRLCTTP